MLAISCRIIFDISSGEFILLERMTYIFIVGNPSVTYFTWPLYLHKVRSLNLHYFKLPDICSTFDQSFQRHSSLFALDISKNQINILKSHCLQSQINMVVLNISRNNIAEIKELAFFGLKSLHVMDLSCNNIPLVNDRMFLGIESIIFFRFYGNDLKTIDDVTFKHLISIKLIVTNDFRICCIKPCSNTICNTIHLPEESNTCQGLITNNIVIIIMFSFAFVMTVINLTSLYRITAFDTQSINQNTCFEIRSITKHLLLSDLSCAMYIILIAVGNIYINISATAHELYWRHHVACYISCVLQTYFQMTSIAVILFMALARWLVVKYPLTSKFKHISFTTLSLRYMSATILIFSISLTLFYILNSDLQVLPNSLSTIFYDTLKKTFS